MRSRLYIWLRIYQVAAGLCDSATGVALVLMPAMTLHLMGIDAANSNLVWLSYIGAFVLAVGLSYFFPLMERGQTVGALAVWRMQWRISAMARTLIAAFIVWKFSTGELPWQWLEVAATDGCFALMQWTGLWRRWLKDVE